jgi:hypothetical protein
LSPIFAMSKCSNETLPRLSWSLWQSPPKVSTTSFRSDTAGAAGCAVCCVCAVANPPAQRDAAHSNAAPIQRELRRAIRRATRHPPCKKAAPKPVSRPADLESRPLPSGDHWKYTPVTAGPAVSTLVERPCFRAFARLGLAGKILSERAFRGRRSRPGWELCGHICVLVAPRARGQSDRPVSETSVDRFRSWLDLASTTPPARLTTPSRL